MKFRNRYRVQIYKGDPVTVKAAKAAGQSLDDMIKSGIVALTDTEYGHNDVVDVGAEKMLVDTFDGGTPSTSWFLGLVNNSGFTAFAAGDTMSSHAGWTEYTGYTEGTRPEWEPDAPSMRAIVNGTTVDFSINATATLQGAFLVDESTKSGTTGTLWATMAFTAPKAVDDGTVLRLTYTIEVAA